MHSMRVPNVSIGLPVYNGEKYLPAALDSILHQDYENFEVVISDNASTDSTQEICEQYAAQDGRIRYFRAAENQGATRNFRIVFEKSVARYFKWAYHDDAILPGFLRHCVGMMDEAPPTVALVAPRTEVIDGEGQRTDIETENLVARGRTPHERIAQVLRVVQWAPAQCGIFRADVLRQTRLIDSFYGSDYVLLMEVALRGEIWEVPEVLFQRRFHPDISTLAHQGADALASWFDPSSKARKARMSPHNRLAIEFLRSIRAANLPMGERLLCYSSAMGTWYGRAPHRAARTFWRRAKRKARKTLGFPHRGA